MLALFQNVSNVKIPGQKSCGVYTRLPNAQNGRAILLCRAGKEKEWRTLCKKIAA